MKYYSEKLNKVFDTEEVCLSAEKEFEDKLVAEEAQKKKLSEERKARAKEIEDAFQAIRDAQTHYCELREQFIRDYGSFHMTFSTSNNDNFWDIFEDIFKFF